MKTVMIFGTFDILHPGHLSLFRQARRYGDRLIAVVARDANVKKVKGRSPYHTEKERKAILEHIDLIDAVLLGDTKKVYAAILKIKPDVIALGYDQKAFVQKLHELEDVVSGKIKIVRLRPHKQRRHKTHKIKAYLHAAV